LSYTIVLEEGDDGAWAAFAPDLPGLLLLGDTRQEIIDTAPGAIADYLDALHDDGVPPPEPGGFAVLISPAA
jgi:predicted RNase H-like HicB family nuclease